MDGGDGDDTYVVDNAGDTVVEGSGSIPVRTRAELGHHDAGANVENLTLADAGSNTQTFENCALAAPRNHQWRAWTGISDAHDAEIVDLGGNKVFRMSSDPASGDFGGPYSPDIERQRRRAADHRRWRRPDHQVQREAGFDYRRRLAPRGRFRQADGTDRNNFMVIENIAGGLRIAVAEPNGVDGNFDLGGTFPTDWRELTSGLSNGWHDVELRLQYKDGPNNDVIQIWVDGNLIGTTTTFENYHDFDPNNEFPNYADHKAAAEDYQTNRIFFRGGDNGQPQDGNGPLNKGFYFDDIPTASRIATRPTVAASTAPATLSTTSSPAIPMPTC